ncbi:multimeric flavodoxin WrbA [Hydrogenispora ethanolica]|uniref:Multimeric flavodoxin WrbA n=1 Tax=Hydrogenispora ethanolica TaxID=1082276 RepID=A0A4R1QSL5_HYDET|nr:flavodoxin family protein [Hydrogenispora ethanolica]TCL56021.1 multimeric flavodoxin WrbA [Hydrogenispora ethanolica]
MKVMAFIGSPRRDGNTAKIVNAICKGAKESGHEVDVYNLSEMNHQGCIACDACQLEKVDFCSMDDKLTKLFPQIVKADYLIVGTPIYMLQVSGVTKNFLDRFRPFLKPDLTAKHLPGKKYITVTCSGAPAAAFSNVTEYLNQLFGYFGMENAGNIIVGDLNERDDMIRQSEILEEAENMGKKLS